MTQRSQDLRLLFEPAQALFLGAKFRRQDLDSDRTFQPRIASAVNLAHAAFADQGADLVRSQPLSNSEWHLEGTT